MCPEPNKKVDAMSPSSMARHLLLTVLLAVPSLAQEGSDADTPAARSGQENSTIHKPGPQYFALRYNEDWGYLEEAAGTYEQDLFDPLKNVDLGGDWRLDIGGSIRLRMMAETNKRFGAASITQNTYPLQQYLRLANLRYKDVPRLFVEGIHAQADEPQTPAMGIDENLYDLHQAFLDIRPLGWGTPRGGGYRARGGGCRARPVQLRLGRRELLFGHQRLISPLMWANTRRRFDGVRLIYRADEWDLDAFYVRPVPVHRREGLDRKLDEYR